MCDARSSELPRYGIKTGLTNYPASYAVGLLLARRLNQKYGLDETYTGRENITCYCYTFVSSFSQFVEDEIYNLAI